MTMKSRWISESESYGSPGLVRIHHIAHGPVPTRRTDAKWPVQSHRRPLSTWPQSVLFGRQGVQKLSDRSSARMDVSLVNILDHALRLVGGSVENNRAKHPSGLSQELRC